MTYHDRYCIKVVKPNIIYFTNLYVKVVIYTIIYFENLDVKALMKLMMSRRLRYDGGNTYYLFRFTCKTGGKHCILKI